MKFLLRILILVVFVVAVLGCKEKAPGIYRIGALLPTSGEAEGYGQQVKYGLTLAMEEINQGGGIQGRKIDIFFDNDESSDTVAVQKVNQMIKNSRVPLIIGGVTSNVALAMAPICGQNKVVLLSPSASSPKLSGINEYFFRNYPSDTLEGRVMAAHAVRRMNIKNVAILFVDKEYGQGLRDVFKSEFTNMGGTVSFEQGYSEGTTDFAPIVKEIKTAAPNAIYLPGYYSDIALILRELKKQKVESKIISSGGMASPRLLEMAGEEAEGVVFPQPPYDAKSSSPVMQKFVSSYKAKFFTEPDVYAAYAYDALKLVALAIDKSGANYPGELRNRMADLSGFNGVTGEVSFDPKGDVDITPRIFQVKGGAFAPVQ